MGRPIAQKTIELHKIFAANEQCFVKENKVVEPKSDIWTHLCKKLPNNITISNKALYTAALKWWSREVETLYHSSSTNISAENSSIASNDSSPIVEQKRSVKFSVELSAKVWETIKPVTKLYSRKNDKNENDVRSYQVLKPGVWSNVILDHVTQNRRDIPCVWVFERNKCYREGVNFLKIEANCKMCCSILYGTLENEPNEDEPVKIAFEIKSLDLSRHDNVEPANVKIGGEYAKKVYQSNKTATATRRSLLRRKASLFKRPYGRVPSANSIRCGKYRNRKKGKLSSDPYDALSYLKASTKYMNTIRFIGKDPFTCIYSSPDQVKLYKAYKKKNRFTKVSLDASAGVANRLERPGGEKSGQIFFCTMVISDGFQVPIHSMLSELNDTKWIIYFMSDWVSRTSEIPNQCTSDMSMALLNGAVRSFTSCAGVADYIEVMFDLLQGNTQKKQIPQCFIRIDIAHFMKNVTTCEALQNRPKKMRDFFIRSVAWLLTVDDLNQAKQHIFSLLVVATSLTEGSSTTLTGPVPCEIHKRELIRKITGDLRIDEAEKTADLFEKSVLEDTLDKTIHCTNLSVWLEDIHDEATETVSSFDDGDRDNLMFNPQFVAYFIDLLRLYPLWSAICCPFFPRSEPIASSGNVESHIKVVKQSMEQLIPCSVDKFVHENMDMNAGLIIESSQKYIKFISDPEKMEFDFPNAMLPHLPNSEGVEDTSLEENSINEILIDKDYAFEKQVGTDLEDDEEDVLVVHEMTSGVEKLRCPACTDKNLPSEAHKCIVCGNNVHTLPGCSVSIGDREGYGEKRVCVSCDRKRQTQKKDKIIEMGYTEQWCRTSKRQLKKSKYRMTVPNWNLNHHFDKNVKIGFLTNGNMSLRVFGTKNNLIGVKNTCNFDVLAQILAAVYAYLPLSRSYMEDTNEGIFEIAIALAKNDNMNKINNMRARLLNKFDTEQNVCEMMSLMLKNRPCIVFNWKCNICEYTYSSNFEFIQVKISNNLEKLNEGISQYLDSIKAANHFCTTCEIMIPCSTIKVNDLLFVTLEKNKEESVVSLAEIPEIMKIRKDNCSLFGAIVYLDSLIEGDKGHFIAAIKVNSTWSIFDDKKSKSYFINSKKTFSIHTLLYTKKSENDFKNPKQAELHINSNIGARGLLKRKTENVKENLVLVERQLVFESTGINKKKRVSAQTSTLQEITLSASKETSIERIGILANGCSYMVGSRRIFLRNTCAFDSIAHILAAAFKLSDSYKNTFGDSEDAIFCIASLLANNDSKKKINNLRSNLLMNLFGKTNNSFVITEILSRSLKHAPSILETSICSRESCKYRSERLGTYLAINMDVFENNMENIEKGIYANLNCVINCLACKNDLCVHIRREFGHHLFIEVPSASLNQKDTDFERIIIYKLSQLRQSIEIDKKRYSLFGIILFQPPEVHDSVGHYVTAVNVNQSYFVLDDYRTTVYRLEADAEMTIHCLFYIDSYLLQGHGYDESSFEISTNAHSDESLYRLYHKIPENVETNNLRL